MSSGPSFPLAILFHALYLCYWLFIKVSKLLQQVYRWATIGTHGQAWVLEKIGQMRKVPSEVVLSVELRGLGKGVSVYEAVKYWVEFVAGLKLDRLSLFLSGDDQHVIQTLTAMLKDTTPIVKLINFDQFHSSLTHSLPPTSKTVPLVLAMGPYPGLHCLPFHYLVDAEFAFCPPVTQCLPADLHKCFEQYAQSQQRHGK